MALPAILAALGLTETVWLAVTGLIRLIAWLLGIVYVGSYIRDAYTKSKETDIQQSEDKTITDILARTDLTADQKRELIMKYLNLQDDKTGPDLGTIAIMGAVILGAAYVLGSRK